MLDVEPVKWKLEPREVCLTFDDGPGDVETLNIAEFLNREGIKATFFVVGQRVDRPGGREALAKLRELGHLIGNHTFTHPYLAHLAKESEQQVVDEVVRTHELIREFTAGGPLFFRPPYLSWDRETCEIVNSADEMKPYIGPIGCDVMCFDWDLGKKRNGVPWGVSQCQDYLESRLRKLEKGVILLHDGSADKNHTEAYARRERQVLELTHWLVGWLKEENYKFVGLEETVRR